VESESPPFPVSKKKVVHGIKKYLAKKITRERSLLHISSNSEIYIFKTTIQTLYKYYGSSLAHIWVSFYKPNKGGGVINWFKKDLI